MSYRPIIVCVAVLACLAAPLAAAETVTGRYVHVTVPGAEKTLSLAEVQVFCGGINVALKKPTVQTTTNGGGVSARAVDGDTNGNWRDGSVTHTSVGRPNPAWEVDLGAAMAIEKIVVWNRRGSSTRLNGVHVSILDGKRMVLWGAAIDKPGASTELAVGAYPKCSWAGQTVGKIVPGKVSRAAARGRRKRPPRTKRQKQPAPPVKPVPTGTPKSLRLAIEDLTATFGRRYPNGAAYLKRLSAIDGEKLAAGEAAAKAAFDALQKEALLANPLLEFDKLLVIRRKGQEGLPSNWLGNCSLPRGKFDNEIAVLSPVSPEGKLTTLYKPDSKEYVGDVDLHWSAEKMLFSTIGTNERWQVFEVGADGKGLRQVSKGGAKDVDNYDACYLPNGQIVFCSTAPYHAVPCVGGKQPVGNLYLMDADGTNVRQLCFEQDHDWYPTVLPNGRVMYVRWEYSDTPHYFTRLVMTMHPDGSGQQALYGTNSYWPNSVFYPRPLPGSNTKFVGIVSGHHGEKRQGELVIFDADKGMREARGVVQRIPGYGKAVVATIKDRLVSNVWPKFLHPWPLGEPGATPGQTGPGAGKYFLASCKLAPRAQWAVHLVDVFDNIVPLCAAEGEMILEPVPLRPTPRPPLLASRIDTDRTDAVVLMVDVYRGPGLKDIPRGAVRKLRLLSYHFAYNRSGGHASVGAEAGWDIKRILGTVPVESDGSAMFRIPANTPIAVQPLDEKGRALQLMRSWFVGMPGEFLSCVGCHEPMSDVPPLTLATAAQRQPSDITPWYGPARPFGFATEVRPVLEKYCVGCHNGANGGKKPDFSKSDPANYAKDVAYTSLHPYVRRPGPESDNHMFQPMEYHVSTSPLFRMLEKGHHNVKLDAEAMDRLVTWVDLNVPHRGRWAPAQYEGHDQPKRRIELARLYANIDSDPETEFTRALAKAAATKIKPVMPKPLPKAIVQMPRAGGWPFDPADAAQRQKALAEQTTQKVDLGGGVTMELTLIPGGRFVMGDADGCADERPLTPVKIDRAFWMGVCEVTNQQFAQFDPAHDSRFIDQQWKDHTTPGYPANGPDQPVIRVNWRQATAFCRWLSQKTGRPFTLPTEAQWEWACRAGSGEAMGYGEIGADFAKFANLADSSLRLFAVKGVNPKPVKNPSPAMAFLPRIDAVDDGQMIAAPVGSYQANAWGLKDMHGNVAEWTRSAYRPYPYDDADGRNGPDATGRKVVRGGSWRDRPTHARAALRLPYPPYQRVFNVGFRVVCEAAPTAVATK